MGEYDAANTRTNLYFMFISYYYYLNFVSNHEEYCNFLILNIFHTFFGDVIDNSEHPHDLSQWDLVIAKRI